MAKKLMKGNEAIGEAAIHAGCTHYFGYPITPQTEIAEYLAKRLPEVGGVFLQAESELGAANMIYGSACTGTRVFTSSSSPGVSLMAEAMSYIAGSDIPAVFVNIMRAGPGLGGILPSQADYFQAVKGGGHGDYRCLVLAPSTVQEAVDLMVDAFDLADKYRSPVMLVGDGMIGQMMEPVEFKPRKQVALPPKDWATTGCKGRKPNVITSVFMDPEVLHQFNLKLGAKYEEMKKHEVRVETYKCDRQMDLLLVAYGTTARICKTSIDMLDELGIKAGLLRPITLFPYPEKELYATAKKASKVLVVEMSMGQMLEDVERILKGEKPIEFFGRTGGLIPAPEEVFDLAKKLVKK